MLPHPWDGARALTSMEKRRWFCRRHCTPGDGCPGSSPLSVGEKVLESGWGSLPRGPSCRSARERRGVCVLPPFSPKASSEGVVKEGKNGLWGRCRGQQPQPLTLIALVVQLGELLCELSQGLLDGLGAGHGQGEAALKVLHLIHDQQGPGSRS